jgi:DNA polymerase-3 subunit delta'
LVTAFEGLIGHAPVLDLLEAELEHPGQAYLFVGPANVGKSIVARHFVAGMLCGDDEACRARVLRLRHPDLILVEPEGRASITVDQARRVVAQASLSPFEAPHKVFLFEEGGLMNEEAANALLKTLEEPTPATVFIIITEAEEDLPATVASRCRTVVFGRVGESEVADGLVAAGIEADQAVRAALLAGGRPGLALSLATKPEVADFRRLWLSIPMRLGDHPGHAFRLADEILEAAEPLLVAMKERQQEARDAAGDRSDKALRARQERELKRAVDSLHVTGLEILASFYRDVAAAQHGAPIRNPDIPAATLASMAPARAIANAELALSTIDALRANQRPQLAFAALFASLSSDA